MSAELADQPSEDRVNGPDAALPRQPDDHALHLALHAEHERRLRSIDAREAAMWGARHDDGRTWVDDFWHDVVVGLVALGFAAAIGFVIVLAVIR